MTVKTEIVIHATDTPKGWMEGASLASKIKEIERWHIEGRGWSGIAYNFLGDIDGEVGGGRDLDNDGDFAEETGAHTRGYNTRSIGYALIGGHGGSADDQFSDHYTPEQDFALRNFIARMEQRFGPLKVTGHNQYANKACPCFNVEQWLGGKERKARTSPVESTSIQAAATGVMTVGGGAVGAVASLEGPNQTVALVVLGLIALLFMYLMKERIRHWGRGVR